MPEKKEGRPAELNGQKKLRGQKKKILEVPEYSKIKEKIKEYMTCARTAESVIAGIVTREELGSYSDMNKQLDIMKNAQIDMKSISAEDLPLTHHENITKCKNKGIEKITVMIEEAEKKVEEQRLFENIEGLAEKVEKANELVKKMGKFVDKGVIDKAMEEVAHCITEAAEITKDAVQWHGKLSKVEGSFYLRTKHVKDGTVLDQLRRAIYLLCPNDPEFIRKAFANGELLDLDQAVDKLEHGSRRSVFEEAVLREGAYERGKELIEGVEKGNACLIIEERDKNGRLQFFTMSLENFSKMYGETIEKACMKNATDKTKEAMERVYNVSCLDPKVLSGDKGGQEIKLAKIAIKVAKKASKKSNDFGLKAQKVFFSTIYKLTGCCRIQLAEAKSRLKTKATMNKQMSILQAYLGAYGSRIDSIAEEVKFAKKANNPEDIISGLQQSLRQELDQESAEFKQGEVFYEINTSMADNRESSGIIARELVESITKLVDSEIERRVVEPVLRESIFSTNLSYRGGREERSNSEKGADDPKVAASQVPPSHGVKSS